MNFLLEFGWRYYSGNWPEIYPGYSAKQWQLVLILWDERSAVCLRSERLAYF